MLLCAAGLCAQSVSDSLSADSLRQRLFSGDSLSFQTIAPAQKLPQNLVRPQAPRSPLDIDRRGSSFYTPRYVQDKMDVIMNRPRSDSFVPIFPMAVIVARIAMSQIDVDKLFEPSARDYIMPDSTWQVLELLWEKSPQTIETIYPELKTDKPQTARNLEKQLALLAERGLLKTRVDEQPRRVWFFPTQKPQEAAALLRSALRDSSLTPDQINNIKKRLSDFGEGQ